MYKRSAVMICFILALVSFGLFVIVLSGMAEEPQYDQFGKEASVTGKYYYMDGGNEGIRIFSLYSDNGELDAIYVDRKAGGVDLCAAGEKVYVLLEDETRRDEMGLYRAYRLREFTSGLVPSGTSIAFELHPEEQAADIWVENGKLFLTALSSDGKTAEVYSLPINTILEAGEKETEARSQNGGADEAEPETADSIYLEEAGKGRFFVDAVYRESTLYKRFDGESAQGYFVGDEKLRELVDNMEFSFSEKLQVEKTFVITWVAGTIIAMLIVILGFVLFSNRRRMVYTGLLVEAVFVAMIVVFYLAYVSQSKELIKEAREDYSANALAFLDSEMGEINEWAEDSGHDSWYDSVAYRGAQSTLSRFVKQEGNRNVFYDAFVMELSSGKVICSGSGSAGDLAKDIYGENALWDSLMKKGVGGVESLSVVGRSLAVQSEGGVSYALVGVVNEEAMSLSMDKKLAVLRNALILFVIGTALLAMILWLQSSDIHRFEVALGEVAASRKRSQKSPRIKGNDLNNMWNSLGEIDKKIEEMNYSRYRVYEAYYRFAPKNIEKILKKESVYEVKSGDTTAVSGTLAFVAGDKNVQANGRIRQLNRLLGFLADNPDKEGIIVSDRDGLAVVELLFLEEAHYAQEFAVDLQRYVREGGNSRSDIGVLLYYGSFIYGIAGTEDQSLAFMLSMETREMARMAEWLRSMRLSVVVTEDVKRREAADYELRYIGFIVLPGSGREMKLYEVLDACPKKERQLKQEDAGRFAEALQLFYQKDYYIARNAFSDILKRNPEDEIARWYLFESERLLDAANMVLDHPGALHVEGFSTQKLGSL